MGSNWIHGLQNRIQTQIFGSAEITPEGKNFRAAEEDFGTTLGEKQRTPEKIYQDALRFATS